MCEMCGRSWDQTWVKPGDSGVGFRSVAYILPVKKGGIMFCSSGKDWCSPIGEWVISPLEQRREIKCQT